MIKHEVKEFFLGFKIVETKPKQSDLDTLDIEKMTF
jgi:hypothetical protein